MPVRGLDSALKKTDTLTRDISEVKAERAVTAALITGQAFASMLTPVDTSFLINSQYRDIKKQGSKFIGAVGYTALYAAAVHAASGKLKGQPRAHFGTTKDGKEFGGGTGVGRYWDPSAEPGFLTKGFNDNRELVDQAFYGAMKI